MACLYHVVGIPNWSFFPFDKPSLDFANYTFNSWSGLEQAWGRVFHRACRTAVARGVVGSREDLDMPTGKVKWFNDQKGFGFVQMDDSGEDVFVHHSVIQMDGYRTLAEGQIVEVDFERGPKGLKATSCRSVH